MLSVTNVAKSFGGRELFDEITFTLTKKERCALLGRNGSGKSTLMKILASELEADAGEILVPQGYTIGYLRQHMSFSKASIREEVLLGRADAMPYEADTLLCGLGFTTGQLDDAPSSFSGGYQLRVELAKTLIGAPDLLLLDEPTNYLDIPSIRFLERTLHRWPGECIIISHDRSFLDRVCTHCMGLSRKRLKRQQGKTSEFFQALALEEESKRRENENIRKQKAHLTKYVERFRFKASKASQAQSKMKAIERLGQIDDLVDEVQLAFSFSEAPHPGKQILSVKNVCFSYDKPLIEKVSFDVLKGDRIAIIGKNGCGKTTLLRLLAQELAPAAGHLKYSMNATMGYFAQTNVSKLKPSETIYQAIKRANDRLKEQQVRDIAGQMLFSNEDIFKEIKVLSGGEKARVLLGQLIATPTNLLLLDEPTNHLDIESTEALLHAIERFTHAVIIVTHNEWILEAFKPDTIILCHEKGQTIHMGDYPSFLEKIGWDEEKPVKAPKPKKPKVGNEELKAKKKQIRLLEKEIAQLEGKKERINAEILQHIEEGGGDFAKLSQSLHATEEKIERLFTQLEKAYNDTI